jgi:four helix bundle protein
MNNPSIQDRTKQFAVRVIKAYVEINRKNNFDDAVRVLSKQFLRSGTSIGANCAEAKSAQSTRDFVHKYEIALKEAQEFRYWVEIMIDSEIIPIQKFSSLLQETTEIINILAASIKSLKQKNF